MPELPEVETTVNFLKPKIIGKTIIDVWSDYNRGKFAFSGGFKNFKNKIIGRKIQNVSRRAKNILIELDNHKILLIHLKMTGHLLLGRWEKNKTSKGNWKSLWSPIQEALKDPYNDYIHFMIFFSDGSQLALSDLRKFGKIRIYESINSIKEFEKLGPEPLDQNLTWRILKEKLKNKKQAIKKVLMDQSVIAGIGNIYSDDILWCAKIHPLKKANTLKDDSIKSIFKCTKKILKEAIFYEGTSIQDYRKPNGKKGYYQEKRKVYQKKGEKCQRCKKGIIKKIKIGARSSCFCPVCQKL